MKTVGSMFVENAERYASRPSMTAYIDGTWKTYTWADVGERVRNVAYGLMQLGVQRGDRVALMSENRPEWAWTDFAVASLGAVLVTVYPTNTAEDMSYIVQDSGATIVLGATAEHLEKIRKVRSEIDKVRSVIVFDPPAGDEGDDFMSYEALMALGKEHADEEGFRARVEAVEPDDLLTLIYTSGTTGHPKGVMLTNDNMLSNVRDLIVLADLYETDSMLSFLPLSHSLERTAGHYTPHYMGLPVTYARSIKTLTEDLVVAKPTILVCVPRIFEKIYNGLMAMIAEANPIRRAIFHWSVGVGKEASKVRQAGGEPGGLLGIKYTLAKALVFNKIKDRLGGRIRFLVSGGAPLSRSLAEFFHAADLLICEGYGLTESSPVITCNVPTSYRFGTTGRTIPSCEVKIAPDGEILAKGANIMKGYWNKPEATEEVLEDGWLHTGDVGELDKDGFLRITDRKKDIIVTAGGKNIAPQNIENAFKLQSAVEQVCVIGDQRKYLVALVVPNRETLAKHLADKGLELSDDEAIPDDEYVRAFIQEAVDAVNGPLARYETIKKFAIIGEPFSIENAMLTPSLKVRRKNVMKTYADIIDAMYH